MDIENLNKHYALPGVLHFEAGGEGLILAHLLSPVARAAVALQGAHLLDYQRHGEPPLLWLSEAAQLRRGMAVRGGVPICSPWFGAAEHAGLPAHGLARTAPWRPIYSAQEADGSVVLELELLLSSAQVLEEVGAPLQLRYRIRMGETLSLSLQSTNTGHTPARLSEALHSYFHISDVAQVTLHGLYGHSYIDKVAQGARSVERNGIIHIEGEFDRIYLDHCGVCEIRDPQFARTITIRSRGSRSTVVWNPGADKAAAMTDMSGDGYRQMLCVESGNAADNRIELNPGAVHTLAVEYGIAPL